MFELWTEDLTPEEEDAMLEKAAREIKKRKLEVPAILMFEMHKPLNYIAANAAVMFSPFLIPMLGFDSVNNYSRLFAKRENVERLICRLEEPDPPAEPAGSTEDSC
jgi:hypothetical protein